MLVGMMMLGLSLTACGSVGTDNTSEKSGQTETQAVAGESPALENSDAESSDAKSRIEDGNQSKETKNGEQSKILVAYFSWADNAKQDNIDAMTSASVNKPGDVAQLASWVSEETGGLASSVKDISAAMPDAKISDNVFDVYEGEAASAKGEIVEWVEKAAK